MRGSAPAEPKPLEETLSVSAEAHFRAELWFSLGEYDFKHKVAKAWLQHRKNPNTPNHCKRYFLELAKITVKMYIFVMSKTSLKGSFNVLAIINVKMYILNGIQLHI